MRSFINSFIILFTVANFTYANIEICDLSSDCVKKIKRTDLDCHSHAEKEENSHTEGDCHCDCHIGHLHS